MRTFAIIASIAILVGYRALMHVEPTWYGWLHPRGGMPMLGISLAIANVALWASGQPDRTLNQRFQLAAAAWIWILVQAGGIAYLYWHATTG